MIARSDVRCVRQTKGKIMNRMDGHMNIMFDARGMSVDQGRVREELFLCHKGVGGWTAVSNHHASVQNFVVDVEYINISFDMWDSNLVCFVKYLVSCKSYTMYMPH